MPAINYAKLTTPADFKKAAANFTKRNLNLRNDMQAAALCALAHMDQHGDYTSSMMPLIEASKTFGKNLHVAFSNWVMAYSWLHFNVETKTWSKDKSKEMRIDDAKVGKIWAEHEAPPKPDAIFDAQKAVDQLFAKIEKAMAKGEIDTAKVLAIFTDKLGKLAVEDAVAGKNSDATQDQDQSLAA